MKKIFAILLVYLIGTMPLTAQTTSQVISSSSTVNDSGEKESDFVIKKILSDGSTSVIEAHTTSRDNGSSYHWTVLGTVHIYKSGMSKTIPIAATLHGVRGSFNSDGTQNHIVHSVRQIHGQQSVSDKIFQIDPNKDGMDVNLSLEQKMQIYDSMPCSCKSAALRMNNWLWNAVAKVVNLFHPVIHAQTGDPWVDCYMLAESVCYAVGILLGPEIWLVCMTTTYLTCLAEYGNLWP